MADLFYPQELAKAERDLVKARRRRVGLAEPAEASPHYLGLALSGGGIRSATFCLGVCQHLARAGLLRKMDFLSTVSGGGYLGAFLGAWIHRAGVDEVEKNLSNNDSLPIRFLRENGRYIAPNGVGDTGVAAAAYLRGWFAVLFTVGIFAFAVFLLGATAQEFILSHLKPDWQPGAPFWRGGGSVAGAHHLWFSPWWLLQYLIVMLWILPLYAAFWLLGDKPLRIMPMVWGLFLAAAVLLILADLQSNHPFQLRNLCQAGPLRSDLREDLHGLGGILALLAATAAWGYGLRAESVRWKWVLKGLAIAFVLFSYDQFNGPIPFYVPPLLSFGWHIQPGWQVPSGWHVSLLWQSRRFSPAVVLEQANRLLHFHFQMDSVQAQILRASATLIGSAWVIAFGYASYTQNVDLARRKLTEFAALGLWLMAGLSLYAIVDTLGGMAFDHWARLAGSGAIDNADLLTGLMKVGPVAAAGFAAAQRILRWVAMLRKKNPQRGLPVAFFALLAAMGIGLVSLVLLSLSVHLIAAREHAVMTGPPFRGGTSEALLPLAGLALALLVVSALVGYTKTLLNLSSDLQVYTARLTRAYLGATNPARQRSAEKLNVTQPVRNDDIPYREYHPEAKGGPLHLINTTVNETISGFSNLEQKDRHGFPLVLGAVGLTAGRTGHAKFVPDRVGRGQRLLAMAPQKWSRTITALEQFVSRRWRHFENIRPWTTASFNPLARRANNPSDHAVEMLTLGGWVGISGAAVGTGLGAGTGAGYSFLAGLFNVRLGYWWDSGLSPRRRRPRTMSILQWVGLAFSGAFPAQSYLLDELLARFHGPAARKLWNLSDGGHFENTGVYELLRRRVRLIVLCDCGADSSYAFGDLANLVRKARIDFSTRIELVKQNQLKQRVHADLLPAFGDTATFGATEAKARAVLADLHYPEGPPGVLLVLKPIARQSEPMDVLDYVSQHASFPQESTVDQFFNEAQWESYRCLGELTAREVFAPVNGAASAQGETWSPFAGLQANG